MKMDFLIGGLASSIATVFTNPLEVCVYKMCSIVDQNQLKQMTSKVTKFFVVVDV